MRLTHCCIITESIEKMKGFYHQVLQISPDVYGSDYVEFKTNGAVLSLYSLAAHEQLAPSSALAGSNQSIELEFQVEQIHEHYTRLCDMGIQMVKEVSTQPWDNTSFYFRDPDGNLINFYQRGK